jgi:hypothetical protein
MESPDPVMMEPRALFLISDDQLETRLEQGGSVFRRPVQRYILVYESLGALVLWPLNIRRTVALDPLKPTHSHTTTIHDTAWTE